MIIGNRRGFALPITIFLVTFITILLTAGFSRVRADRQITSSSDFSGSAFSIAQSGLESYMGTSRLDACSRPDRPADGDSVRINVTGGYAWVVPRVVRRPADTLTNWTYLIRSTGYALDPAAGGSTPIAQRTVAQMAEWQPGFIVVQASFTAANGLTRLAGGTGEFRGEDTNSGSSCDDPFVNSLRVPGGEDPSSMTGYILSGITPYVLANNNGLNIATFQSLDWFGITNTGTLRADTYSLIENNWDYLTQLILGPATLGSPGANTYGTGLLIVSGDLTITGNNVQWYGIILVGGRIIFQANDQRFDGIVVSGLNEQLGIDVTTGTIGGVSYLDIDYNSFYVRRSLQALSGFTPISNAWIDNWAEY